MRYLRKGGRLRAGIAAAVLVISSLVAVPAAAQSARAQDICSDTGVLTPFIWELDFNSNGVTVCKGNHPDFPDGGAWIQIVDLTAGAKVRKLSEACFQEPVCATNPEIPLSADRMFFKRTADAWWNWIKDPANFRTPGPNRLLSVSNVSFFVDNAAVSRISLPGHSTIEKRTDGTVRANGSIGWAWGSTFTDEIDPAWDQPKVALQLGDSTLTRQSVRMASFPTHFTDIDTALLFNDPADQTAGDQTVGFAPLNTVGSAPRTYVGVDSPTAATKVFILNSAAGLTGAEAQRIIGDFGGTFTAQFDGGGSTQLMADLGRDGSPEYLIESDDLINRPVPDALAVYLGP